MKKNLSGSRLPVRKPMSEKAPGVRLCAFSLVEMLMALLVASLLLSALAPVITKRYNEELKISGFNSGVKSDYSRTFYKDAEWTVPSGVNVINVTAVGGGGAGGGATYGYKEITASEQNWIVPDGVTKIRVFMTGAGGGGASGGFGNGIAYGSVGGSTGSSTITTTGVSSWTIPAGARNVPALDSKCQRSGVTKWSLVSNTAKTVGPGGSVVTVKACGGGGGGGGGANAEGTCGGGGSSGGYINTQVTIPSNISSVSVTIGGGGGYGGCDDCKGGNALGWGGGGGGTEWQSLYTASGVAPGGNGAFTYYNCGTTYSPQFVFAQNGTGTAGGGTGGGGGNSCGYTYAGYGTLEGGGGGGGGSTGATGGGGGGATFFGRYAYSTSTDKDFFLVAAGGGGGAGYSAGGGGGGYGGGGGGAKPSGGASAAIGGNPGSSGSKSEIGQGGASPIGNSNYCAGGNGGKVGTDPVTANQGTSGTSGKNGYMQISWNALANGLRCNYSQPSNGGGGGGAGQVWIGEISVTPGQSINFNIGVGGGVQSNPGSNGIDGGATSIQTNGTVYSVAGGKGGKFESESAYIENSGGLGGGLRTTNFSSSAVYKNWLKVNSVKGGQNGSRGYLASETQTGAGGKGGNTYKIDGSILNGGNAGGTNSDGGNASSVSYGAGGGGGGGSNDNTGNPGAGGKGANGYIYIEWGNANGGGGASGQVVTKKDIWVSAGTKVKITVGKGGEPNPVLSALNGVSGYFGQKGNDGADSYITTTEGVPLRAKGGLGGNAARTNHGLGGNSDEKVSNSAKGEDGNNDYGGTGGSITQQMCPLLDSLNGLGGCGGNIPSGNCANSSSSAIGKDAAKTGGGGGGGAVKDNAAYTGGKGADGMVTIEWNN